MAISTGMALLGGLSAAGSLAGGLMGQGGAGAAAGAANSATQQAIARAQAQQTANTSNYSPWTSTGINSIGQLGALLGYGSLWNRGGEGATYNWETDPSAQGNAFNNMNLFLSGLNGGASAPAVPTFNTSISTPTFSHINVPTTFEADPGYAWRISEGNKALDRSAASKGMLLSGAQTKALTDWNQNAASNEYSNWWNRYTQGTGFNNQVDQTDYQNRFGLMQYGNQIAQQDYGNKWGQYSDQYNRALGYINLLSGLSGQGANMTSGLTSANTGLTSQTGNWLNGAGQYTGNAMMTGSNALASGIGSGINNLTTAALTGWSSPSTNYTANANYIPTPATQGYSVGSVGGQPMSYWR